MDPVDETFAALGKECERLKEFMTNSGDDDVSLANFSPSEL